MRDLAKVTHVDGISYCDVCGYWIAESTDECSLNCPSKQPPKRPSALAPRRAPKVSLAQIAEKFRENGGGL